MQYVIPDYTYTKSILECAHDFVNEGGYGKPDANVIATTIEAFIDPKDNDKFVIVGEDEGKVVGVIAGFVTPSIFSSERIASEAMWYVKPQYRKSRLALKLLDMYIFWAENIANADSIQLVSNQNLSPDQVEKVYRRKGFKALEKVFIKNGSR